MNREPISPIAANLNNEKKRKKLILTVVGIASFFTGYILGWLM